MRVSDVCIGWKLTEMRALLEDYGIIIFFILSILLHGLQKRIRIGIIGMLVTVLCSHSCGAYVVLIGKLMAWRALLFLAQILVMILWILVND